MSELSVEDQVAEEFEAVDPNYEEFEAENEHFAKAVEGIESIIKQYRDNGRVEIGGCEAYAQGVLRAEGLQWDIHKGYEGFISDSAEKLYTMVMNMLKKIKEFFFGEGGSGEDKMSIDEDKKAIDEKQDAIKNNAEPRNPADAIHSGPALKTQDDLVTALTTEPPKSLSVVRTANDERANTIALVKHDLSNIGKELRTLLSNAGVTNTSEQQKVIRTAIANKASDSHVEATFENEYSDRAFSIGLERQDKNAMTALRSIQTRLDGYLKFFKEHEDILPNNFGEWSGWFVIQHDIQNANTGSAMRYLIDCAKDGSGMERAIDRDTRALENETKRLNGGPNKPDVIEMVAKMQQVLSRECNVAGEIKSSQRKVKKALNRQISVIEKARANLVVNCVKAHLKDK